jgi:phage terminase large subunit-like protein
MCEAGRVYYDADAPWVETLFEELMAFPSGAHDDQVDALVHGINRLKDLGVFLPDIDSLMVDTGHRSIGQDLELPL